jgi:ComF family protein
LHFDRALSPTVYTGPIQELIQQFKYKGKDYLGELLSKLLLEFIRDYHLPLDDIDLIIPVPLHRTRLREREFNQALALGRPIARQFNKTITDAVLVRQKNTRTQTELAPALRLANVRGSFAVRDQALVTNKNILLVDDVLTTGATCSEAALALKNAGAKVVFVLTLAN